MVGLPGSGKSVWVERHCAINTDKKYVVLSTNNIINQMKVNIKKPWKINFVGIDWWL